MVTLTRITGTLFALNPDLIERIDRTPDTVITLVDGTKYLVSESLDEVVQAILDYRAQIVALAGSFERNGTVAVRRNRLSSVPPVAPEAAEEAAGQDSAQSPVVPISPRNP
ncbi:MAG TPA: flagellar FlbD family protein [Nocardioidaceae bacterium]|nr:flagellar FlbD family protein [Nocardioidaceae bacterium]